MAKRIFIWEGTEYELPPYLYPVKGSDGAKWHYIVHGSTFTYGKDKPCYVHEAIALAEQNNKLRKDDPARFDELVSKNIRKRSRPLSMSERYMYGHYDAFVIVIVTEDPRIAHVDRWTHYKNRLTEFCQYFATTALQHLTIGDLKTFWISLTHHQQKNNQRIYREFIQYLIDHNLVPAVTYNPFIATAHGGFRRHSKPESKRKKFTPDTFSQFYFCAGDNHLFFIQVSLLIGCCTGLRLSTVCNLRFDTNIENNVLWAENDKANKLRKTGVTLRHEFDLSEHTLLAAVIDRARLLANRNWNCPYIVSHRFESVRNSKQKTHRAQVLPDYLAKTMRDLARESGVFSDLENEEMPTFHKTRHLFSSLFGKTDDEQKALQETLGHTKDETTKHYQDDGEKKVVTAKSGLVVKPDMLGLG